MRYQIRLEVEVHGESDDVEEFLDDVMDTLVDTGITDPSIGASLASGATEVEFVVEDETLELAHQHGRRILERVLPPTVELIGESTHKAELVSA